MRFLFALVSGFVLGVALRSLFVFGAPAMLFPIIPALVIVAGYWLKGREGYLVALLFFTFLPLGMFRAHLADTLPPDVFMNDLGSRVAYEGTVARDPDVREKTQRVTLRVQKDGKETLVLAVAPHHPTVRVGERVSVVGTLARPAAFETDSGRTFRYDKYLQKDAVFFLLSFARLRVLEPASPYSVPARLAQIKHHFIDGLSSALPKTHATLASGIVIGGRSGLPRTLLDDFTASGLVHLIVLSGYNVMVVAEWMIILIALATRSRNLQVFAGGGALLLFVGVAGFSATATRATVMALIALYARMTSRTYVASRALLVTIFLMILWNPFYLVFDPGFGLSVAATAGIIWFAPLFELRLARLRSSFWKNAAATTLAAQLGVFPLLLYNTGNLSLISLPANLLVVAVMPLAMAFAVLAGVGGMIFGAVAPAVAQLLAFPSHVLMAYLMSVATASASLPWAAVSLPAFSFEWVLLAYALLAFVAFSKRSLATDQLQFAKKAST